jgi:acyl-CoA synthetase (AMP-forming)/AMP-acid ligase II
MEELSTEGYSHCDQVLCERAATYPDKQVLAICDTRDPSRLVYLTYRDLHLAINAIADWLQRTGFVSQRVSRDKLRLPGKLLGL